MSRLWNWLLDLLYPPKCVFCEKLLQKDETEICNRCRMKLPFFQGKTAESPFLDQTTAVFSYEGTVRESLLRYKFGGLQQYAAPYGKLLAAAVSAKLPEVDAVTWVPVSRKRLRQRGYDQAQLLAEKTAEQLGKPLIRTLSKKRNNRTQSTIQSPEARRANVMGVYACLDEKQTAGKRLLLIDDILTTGATMGEAARMLRIGGADAVYGAALAARSND